MSSNERMATEKQKYFLRCKGWAWDDLEKLTLKQASAMIKPYYHRDAINYEYGNGDDYGCFGLGE